MIEHAQDYVLPGREMLQEIDPQFPHAPLGWSRFEAEQQARTEGLNLTEIHWRVIRALQDYFHRHRDEATIQIRELHDALDEAFHAEGGLKRLYELFPGGPVAQGCRIAGLAAPPGAVDRSFGSVV
jgi:tRNA 2-thiouridine synthesizing protein E